MQKIDRIVKAVSLDKTIEVLDYVNNNGGATLDLDCNVVTFNDGYQFAMELPICYEVSCAGGVNISDVQDALCAIQSELKNIQAQVINAGVDKVMYIGIWRDKAKHMIIIEPSFYTDNLIASIILGIENHQEAIFDWSTKSDIKLKDFKNLMKKGGR